jgi:hypothetical protein
MVTLISIGTTVTFKLESVPSSTRSFELTTDVGSQSPFLLSAASPMQVYETVVDGTYDVTLAEDQTTGYDVAVECTGASSYSTSTDTTTFTVAGDHVTCTFTLTGNLTENVILCRLLLTFAQQMQTNCRRFRATTSLRRRLPARAKAVQRLQSLPAIRIPMRLRPRRVITSTARCSMQARRLSNAKPSTALIKRVTVFLHCFCLRIKLTIVQKVRRVRLR